jgi:hypothetical protein
MGSWVWANALSHAPWPNTRIHIMLRKNQVFFEIISAPCHFSTLSPSYLILVALKGAVSLHIRAQDGSEFAFNFLGVHGIPQRLFGRLV